MACVTALASRSRWPASAEGPPAHANRLHAAAMPIIHTSRRRAVDPAIRAFRMSCALLLSLRQS
jgi:hypothetical protein